MQVFLNTSRQPWWQPLLPKSMLTVLTDSSHGYRDYEILENEHGIYRVKVPFNVKEGDIVNVYSGESRKNGFVWRGTLLATIMDAENISYLKD